MLEAGTAFDSDVPGRLDRLPWSRWHWRLVVALGVTWLLDGLEVTIVGSVAGVLGEPSTLHLSDAQIGRAATAYLGGAILGALVFGRLSDRFGRKRLFLVTLALYLGATLCTAASWSLGSFSLFRALTGAGIGGEYAAINSAIDELVPARVRGRVDLAINGTYWLGAALGAASTLVLLDARDRASLGRVAPRVRARRVARRGHPPAASPCPREPSLAAAARAHRGGRAGGACHRARCGSHGRLPPAGPASRLVAHGTPSFTRHRPRARAAPSAPDGARAVSHGRPGLRVQRASSSRTRWCSVRFYGVAATAWGSTCSLSRWATSSGRTCSDHSSTASDAGG